MSRTTIVELRNVDAATNTSKFYRTYLVRDCVTESSGTFDLIVYHWGRIGTAGGWQSERVSAGYGKDAAQKKVDVKKKGGYAVHDRTVLNVIPDEIQRFLAGVTPQPNESLDLTSMLTDAQRMTVDLLEGKATPADVALLTDRAKRATDLHTQLQGRLQALQMLVMGAA